MEGKEGFDTQVGNISRPSIRSLAQRQNRPKLQKSLLYPRRNECFHLRMSLWLILVDNSD